MPFDFPPNPAVGDQVVGSNGALYTWDGVKWTANVSGNAFLPISGGRLTGPLELDADPVTADEAATRRYVDTIDLTPYLRLSGGSMTGPLELAGDAVTGLQPVPLQQLQGIVGDYVAKAGDTMTGQLNVPSLYSGGDMETDGNLRVNGYYGLLTDGSSWWRFHFNGTPHFQINRGEWVDWTPLATHQRVEDRAYAWAEDRASAHAYARRWEAEDYARGQDQWWWDAHIWPNIASRADWGHAMDRFWNDMWPNHIWPALAQRQTANTVYTPHHDVQYPTWLGEPVYGPHIYHYLHGVWWIHTVSGPWLTQEEAKADYVDARSAFDCLREIRKAKPALFRSAPYDSDSRVAMAIVAIQQLAEELDALKARIP